MDKVEEFARSSWVPISAFGQVIKTVNGRGQASMYDETTGCLVSLGKPGVFSSNLFVARFRGAYVDRILGGVPFFHDAEVDIVAGSAEQLLTMERLKFSSLGKYKAQALGSQALWGAATRRAISLRGHGGDGTPERTELSKLSFALKFAGPEELEADPGVEWRQLSLPGSPTTIEEIFAAPCVEVHYHAAYGSGGRPEWELVEGEQSYVRVASRQCRDAILGAARELGHHLGLKDRGRPGETDGPPRVYVCSRGKSTPPIPPVVITQLLLEASVPNTGCRRTIPMLPGFEDLALNKDLDSRYGWAVDSIIRPRLFLPFAFTPEGIYLTELDAVIDYTLGNLAKPMARSDVRARVEKLIHYIDEVVSSEQDWQDRKRY